MIDITNYSEIFFFIGLGFVGLGWLSMPRKFKVYSVAYFFSTLLITATLIATLSFVPIYSFVLAVVTAFMSWGRSMRTLKWRIDERWKKRYG